MNYSFIDLFAGIGGFRSGFETNKCNCVFSSEIDEHAGEIYKANYNETVFKDITKTEFIDDTTVDGATYIYRVFAIDKDSLVSKYSNEVKIEQNLVK